MPSWTTLGRLGAFLLTALAPTLGGCAVDADSPEAGQQSADIIEGDFAHGYPEAVHVNMIDEYGPAQKCSGTLIAPRVVLTAAHCIDGFRAWGIYAPFAGEQGTMATHAEVLDWTTGMTFDYGAHDIGVVLLDEDIVLDHYPSLALEPVENGTKARIVGRTKQGFISPDWLFESEPVTLYKKLPTDALDHERYYYATKMVQKGDSGGPVYATDPDWVAGQRRTITGVVSTMHFMTRVDLVHEWISGYLPAPTE